MGDTPTDEDRVSHEKQAAWSYHVAEGWKMVDNPLTVPPGQGGAGNTLVDATPENLRGVLAASGYDVEPSFVVGGDMAAHVYESRATTTFLVVLNVVSRTADGTSHPRARHFLIARGLPSLLSVLRDLGPVLDKGKPHAPTAG